MYWTRLFWLEFCVRISKIINSNHPQETTITILKACNQLQRTESQPSHEVFVVQTTSHMLWQNIFIPKPTPAFHHKKPLTEFFRSKTTTHKTSNLNHLTKYFWCPFSIHKRKTQEHIFHRIPTTSFSSQETPDRIFKTISWRFVQSTTKYQISTIFRSTFGGILATQNIHHRTDSLTQHPSHDLRGFPRGV